MDNSKINQLLEEMAESRATLKAYVNDVSNLKDKVADMFPKELNFRNRFILDEKIKVMTSFYSVLLNLQQEINKSNKDEIEIRRKMQDDDSGDEQTMDIRKIADLVEFKMKAAASSQIEPEDTPPETESISA